MAAPCVAGTRRRLRDSGQPEHRQWIYRIKAISSHTSAANKAQINKGEAINALFTKIRLIAADAALLAVGVFWPGAVSGANDQGVGVEEKPVRVEKLANAPGKTLTVVIVSYAPGAKSSVRRHAGSVFAYVLSGAIRSENSATGPVKDYKAGESFFEPPGSEHLVSENAGATEPASMLAVFIADDGVRLTTFDK